MTLQHSDTIIGCFHQGKDNLPGLPGNVKVSSLLKAILDNVESIFMPLLILSVYSVTHINCYQVRPIDAHSAMVYWDAPTKNPGAVRRISL